MHTIAGGVVLDTVPKKHRRMDPAVVTALAAKERGTPEDLLETWLQSMPNGGLRREASRSLGITESDVQAAAQVLIDKGIAVALDNERLMFRAILAAITDRGLAALSAYHTANPLRPGMPKEELRGALGKNFEPKAFTGLLNRWQIEGIITSDGASIRRADFAVELNPRQQAMLDRIAEIYRTDGYNTPSVDEISEAVAAPPDAVTAMLRVGQDKGVLVKIAEGLYYHADTVEAAKQVVRDTIAEHGSITVSQFRDITGTSRKYALPVMEYFDTVRFTRRVGDVRVLVTQ
jgi:selenocysteine-specific elongation factor